ncbi:MAG: hypothetical protein J5993_06540 [Clostridia bacterium]|nr:hypothetical protein [Clostridia bacterium]
MYREIVLKMADGDEKAIPFKATGTTSIRYKQLFKKELLGSITEIFEKVGSDELIRLMKDTGEEKKEEDNMSPETLQTLIKITGSGQLDTIQQMAYIMNMQAKNADMSKLSLEGYINWLDQFESFEFLTNSMEFIGLYMGNRETTSSQKKEVAQLTEK